MSVYGDRSERRRKRPFTPIIYFSAEIILLWLVLSLIQVKFNPLIWAYWAMIVFGVGFVYGVVKTVHIYSRQRDYPDVS